MAMVPIVPIVKGYVCGLWGWHSAGRSDHLVHKLIRYSRALHLCKNFVKRIDVGREDCKHFVSIHVASLHFEEAL